MRGVLSPTFGSLFSGLGGIDIGLEKSGLQCRFQIEIDPFCQSILKKRWPTVERYADITTATGLPYVDLLAGGFPCQDLSVAGKRAGIEGVRSGLWLHFARLIEEVKPKAVLIENVPGLLHNRAMSRVLGDLFSLGYDAEWESIPAQFFGAPHVRDRVFVVAYPLGTRLSGCLFGGESLRCTAGEASTQFGNRIISGRGGGRFTEYLRVGDGVSKRLVRSRIKALGNSVYPAVIEWVGSKIMGSGVLL